MKQRKFLKQLTIASIFVTSGLVGFNAYANETSTKEVKEPSTLDEIMKMMCTARCKNNEN